MTVTRRPWEPDHDALALDPSLRAKDVAVRVGRTVTAVYARRQVLRGTSSRPRWRASSFPQLPRFRAQWLIAKTCPLCGQLLPADDFSKQRDGRRGAYCRVCNSGRTVDRRLADVASFDGQVHRRTREKQSESASRARNNRKEWTGPELEYLTSTTDRELQQAERLGRTVYAIRHIKRKMKNDPKIARLAGLGTATAEAARP